ncbi:MAG: C1 family peptidase [Nitrososphaerales archaeon]
MKAKKPIVGTDPNGSPKSKARAEGKSPAPAEHGLGGVRDRPDSRDHPYVPPAGILKNLPTSVDLREQFPPVYNQEQINSCTANAIAGAMEFDAKKQGMKEVFTPSRLFLYYNERLLEGTEGKDVGAAIRDGIKSIAKQGDCPEHHWPYDSKLVTQKPHGKCYHQARSFKALEYQRISHNLDHMRACLASGYPFVFGIRVFTSFQGDAVRKTGHLNMPRKGEKTIGLHAVVACGYDDKNHWFIVRNSWGSDWGMKGYYTMPYEYLMDSKISHDFWTIRVVR